MLTSTEVGSVEELILHTLKADRSPKDLDALIQDIRSEDDSVRAADVKLAALDMVSQGRLSLNEFWQLQTRDD